MIGWVKRGAGLVVAAIGLLLAGVLVLGMLGELVWIVVSGVAGLPMLLWFALCVVIVPAGWWLLFIRRR